MNLYKDYNHMVKIFSAILQINERRAVEVLSIY